MSIRPLVVGGEGLSYGLLPQSPQLDALRQPKAPALNPPPPGMDPRARNAGLAAALSNTPRVEGNSWVEALAAALTGGLRGRTEMDQRQQELADHQLEIDQQTRTQKVEDGRQASIADALTAYQSADPNDPQAQRNALVGALSRGDPQDALPMVSADITRRTPEQPEWQAGYGHAYRINPDGSTDLGGVIPEAPRYSSGGGAGDGLSADSTQDAAMIWALSGMPVEQITGSRRGADNRGVVDAGLAIRRRLHLSPGDFAAVRLAYQGDHSSFQRLQTQRDAVAANEGAARSALANVASMQQRLPRGQISGIPSGNDALQAYNQTLGGQGPLAAYVGALVTARAEYARVISGNNSPPVEAMHEAERMLPANITPSQLNDVLSNLEREMEFRTQAFDSVLGDIQTRVGFNPADDQQAQAPPQGSTFLSRAVTRGLRGGGNDAPPAGIPQAEWDHMSAADRARVQQIMGGQ